jgi:citrate lyase subunit beta/citryl-CoA lyase
MNTSIDARPPATVDVYSARSWLFVPGDRSHRFAKATASGADVVICDLEDAVSNDAKALARANVASWLNEGGAACVRINAHGTPFYDADVAALAGAPGLHAAMVPRAEDPRMLAELSDILGPNTVLIALVETALGLHRAYELAAVPGVARMAFGSIDFALDVSAEETALSMLFARSSLVVASRAAGVVPPVDGVTVRLDDLRAVEADAAAAVSLGFGGKLCVHPHQVDTVNAAFSPSEEDVLRARRIVGSVTKGGAKRLDGQMVDRPIVERARLVLQRAGIKPSPDDSRRP